MTHIVEIEEVEKALSQWLERVHAGEEIILARDGKPYARLLPVVSQRHARRPGRLTGRVEEYFFDPLPEAELRAWEGR